MVGEGCRPQPGTTYIIVVASLDCLVVAWLFWWYVYDCSRGNDQGGNVGAFIGLNAMVVVQQLESQAEIGCEMDACCCENQLLNYIYWICSI